MNETTLGREMAWPRFAWLMPAALMLAWAIACVIAWLGDTEPLSSKLGDTDDALRLVQLREFLGGASWFDLHIERLQPPEGYNSHWSRLIDVGLASVYALARPFTGPEGAELFARFLWPLLWLIPVLWASSKSAEILGGRKASLIALGFGATAIIAFQQFRPGRIDHHNVQVALALLGVVTLMMSLNSVRAAAAAGGIVVLMLAIGLESIPFAVFILSGAALLHVTGHYAWRQTIAFWGAVLISAAVAFLALVPPGQWRFAPCDAYAGNFALGLIAPAAVILAASRSSFPQNNPAWRFALMLNAGLAGLVVFIAFDPVCLGGPFARMNPALGPLWLDHVSENRSVFGLLRDGNLLAFLGAMLHPAVALVAAALLWWRYRNPAWTMALLALAFGIALQSFALKTFSYPAWLAIPPAAVAAAVLFGRIKPKSPLAAGGAVLLLAPITMALSAVILLVGFPGITGKKYGRPEECLATTNYARLAALPPGIVIAPIDLGPSILALTPHSVMAAPYHRLDRGMIETAAIYADEIGARERARDLKLDYLIDCDNQTSPETEGWLLQALHSGAPPTWLDPVPESLTEPLRIYRVNAR
jgi:hypothetical protein